MLRLRRALWGARDAILCGAVTVLLLVEVVGWDGAELRTAMPLALLAGAPLVIRRHHPLVMFVLTGAGLQALVATLPTSGGESFDNSSAAFVLIFFIAIFSTAAHTQGREVWISALFLVATMVAFFWEDGGHDLGGAAFVVFFVGGPWGVGLALRLRGELAESNTRLHLEQEERTRRAVAAERATIARELHDVVAHAISVTVLQSRGARRMLGRDEERVRRALDAIEHTNTQALGDMRRLLAVLRDTEGDAATTPQPSLDRLDALVDQIRGSGLGVDLVELGESRDVPPGVDLSAYRIIQEALTNVLKHAAAAHATVRLEYGDDELNLIGA